MAIRQLAHGFYSLIPTLLTMCGWLFALFQDGCDYVKVTGDIVAQIATTPNAPYIEVGRNAFREPYYSDGSWHTEYVGNCLVYPEDEVTIDVYWNVSKGFDFISIVLGGTGSLFLWFSACCVFSRGTWRLAGCQVFMAGVFQTLSFLWFKTDLCQTNHCDLFWGSWADIASGLCWTLASVSIFCHYPIPAEHVARLHAQDDGSRDGIITTTPSIEHHHDLTPTVDNNIGTKENIAKEEVEYQNNDGNWLSSSGEEHESSSQSPRRQESGEGSGEGTRKLRTPSQIV